MRAPEGPDGERASQPANVPAQGAPFDLALSRIGVVLKQKWRLDRLLGSGGMASVYEATHRTGSRAAIKILHPSHAYNEQIIRRFLREGYVANQVGHPGAVRILDDDIAEDGTAYIVMELLEGETFEAHCQRRGGKLEAAELLPLVDQLLDILAAAHAKQIVHRDIKPENIFITTEGAVKLLDFGVARLRTLNPGSMQTMMGAMFGTPPYMAPEQALGRTEQIDGRSDLWSVGGVMFYATAGRYVHLAQTLTEQIIAQATKHAPPFSTVVPEAPPALAAVIDRALAFDQALRWPDARAMQQAVRDALSAPQGSPVVFGATPPPTMSRMAAASIPEIDGRVSGGSAVGVTNTVDLGPRKRPKGTRRLLSLAFAAGVLVAVGATYLLALRSPAGEGAGEGTPAAPAQADTPAAQATAPVVTPSPSVTPAPPASAPAIEPAASAPSVDPATSAAPSARTKAPARPGASSAPTKPPASNDDWLDRQH